MNIKIIYIAIIGIIVFLFLFFDDKPEAKNSKEILIKSTIEDDKPVVENNIVSINYNNTIVIDKNHSKKIDNKIPKLSEKQVDKIIKEDIQIKIDELKVNTIATSSDNDKRYKISVVLENEYVKNNNVFPQIPVMLKGTIDGNNYSLAIPPEAIEDGFSFVIKDNDSGEEKLIQSDNFIGFKSGDMNNIDIDFHNSKIKNSDKIEDTTSSAPPIPSF